MVMEKLLKNHGTGKIVKKSWNSVFRHGISTNFAPEFDQTWPYLDDIKKYIISPESLHFPTFFEKCLKCKI